MLYIYFVKQNMLKHGKDCLASLLLRPKDSETGFSSETSTPAAIEYPKVFQTAFMRKLIVTSSTKATGTIQLVRSYYTRNCVIGCV